MRTTLKLVLALVLIVLVYRLATAGGEPTGTDAIDRID